MTSMFIFSVIIKFLWFVSISNFFRSYRNEVLINLSKKIDTTRLSE